MESQMRDFGKQIDIKREFERLHHKLNFLIEKQVKPSETWVKVGFIKLLTAWNKEELRRARASNLIKTKRTNKGVVYLLESLNERFIILKKEAK